MPQDEAIPEDGVMGAEMVTAVSEPLEPDRPESDEPEAEMADDGLAALAFLEELALAGDMPLDSAQPEAEPPAIEPAVNTVADDEPVITRALPTEPEMSLEDLADDIPEDPDEAMDWIRSMAEEEPEAPDDEMDMGWLDAFVDETDEAEVVADLSRSQAAAEPDEGYESPVVAEQESPFGSLDLDDMAIEDLFDRPGSESPDDIAAQMTQLGSAGALSDDLLSEEDEEPILGSAAPVDENGAVAQDERPGSEADLFGDSEAEPGVEVVDEAPGSADDIFGDDLVADDLLAGLIEAEEEVEDEPAAEIAEPLTTDRLAEEAFADIAQGDEATKPEPEVDEMPAASLAMEVSDLFAEDAAEELPAES